MSEYIFSYKDFLNPIIIALRELGGSAHITEIEEQIIKDLNLTEKQINKIHNGNRTKLNYDLAWARTYLKKYGLITNSSTGVWTITDKGQESEELDNNKVVGIITLGDLSRNQDINVQSICNTLEDICCNKTNKNAE